jgi:antitoxin CcdA
MRMKNAHSRRRATNLTLDEEVVNEARELKLNVSRIVEERLREVVAQERARNWVAENRAAFEAFSRFVEKHGIFNSDDRDW